MCRRATGVGHTKVAEMRDSPAGLHGLVRAHDPEPFQGPTKRLHCRSARASHDPVPMQTAKHEPRLSPRVRANRNPTKRIRSEEHLGGSGKAELRGGQSLFAGLGGRLLGVGRVRRGCGGID